MFKKDFKILLLIVVIVVLLFLFFGLVQIYLLLGSKENEQNKVCFENVAPDVCFLVEVAKTSAEREQGLARRTQLDKNRGMLFVFEKEGIYPFWMKNTLIPLDIIWLDSNYEIVYISRIAEPCLDLVCLPIVPPVLAKYVLEINSGISSQIGLENGQSAKITVDNF